MQDFNWSGWMPVFYIFVFLMVGWYAYCFYSNRQDYKEERASNKVIGRIKGKRFIGRKKKPIN